MKNEWRVPLTILIFSSLIFTAVTFLFGFNIDRLTGELIINIGIQNKDTWSYNPMSVIWSDFWRYYCMIGYYSALAVFSYSWFEYIKNNKISKEGMINGRNKK